VRLSHEEIYLLILYSKGRKTLICVYIKVKMSYESYMEKLKKKNYSFLLL